MAREDYEVVIGLEVHAELSTKTKIFCNCSTEFGGMPNTHTCPICMAMPGTLPVLNEKAVEYAVKAGLATNCSISKDSKNDRKNYFYPDLPKSYQISQFDKPLCNNGYIEIEEENGEKKKIRILRIHIEEDAGKLNHNEFSEGSLVDLNRAGVPLIEIVSEPDLRSAKEADAYLKKLKSTLEYIEVSDCKMQEGSFRADVNVSIHKPGTPFGTRTEMKNMNSFKSISRAIEYEIQRQSEVLDNGGIIEQETLRWDDVSGRTFSMRNKEDAQDYRYFPEPDLLKLVITDEEIEAIRQTMPESKVEKLARFINDYGLPEYDANILCEDIELADYFEKVAKTSGNGKLSANWIMTDVMRILKEKNIDIEKFSISAEHLGEIIALIEKGTISTKIAKELFEIKLTDERAPEVIVKEKGMVQVADTGAIEAMVDEVIANNPKMVEDYKNSDEGRKPRVIKGLIGQVMKLSKGKANPTLVTEIMTKKLS